MKCSGIFIDARARRTLFNPDLLLVKGHSILEKWWASLGPEELRVLIETRLRGPASPHVTVGFCDEESEPATLHKDDPYFFLVIRNDAPIYSTTAH